MAWLYKRGGVWWLGWRNEGKLYARSTKLADRKEAEKEKLKLDAMFLAHRTGTLTDEFYSMLTGKSIQRQTLDAYLQRWLEDAIRSTTPGTVNKYRQIVREFAAHTRAKETGLLLNEVTPDHVRDFLNRKADKSSPATTAGFRRVLRSIFIQAQEEGKMTGNPVHSANRLKNRGAALAAETSRKRPFTLDEIKTMLLHADDFWKYMILVAYFTGMRMGDIVTLKRINVDLKNNALSFVSRKTGKRQNLPIHPDLGAVFLRMPKGQANEYFWTEQAERYEKNGASSLSQEFYDVMTKAGLVKPRDPKKLSKGKGRAGKREGTTIGFHNFRHTFVSILKLKGAMDSVAKELVGHRSDAINTHYTHLPADMLRLAVGTVPSVE